MSQSIKSLVEAGQHGLVVDIECPLSNNLSNIVIFGYTNKAVDEAKERIRSAFDVAIAVSILLVSRQT